jgi:hypothetical protein
MIHWDLPDSAIWEQMPTYTIAANAGVEGAVVVGKLLEQNSLDIGYNAATGLLLLFACNQHVHCIHSSYLLLFFDYLTVDQGLMTLSGMVDCHVLKQWFYQAPVPPKCQPRAPGWSPVLLAPPNFWKLSTDAAW